MRITMTLILHVTRTPQMLRCVGQCMLVCIARHACCLAGKPECFNEMRADSAEDIAAGQPIGDGIALVQPDRGTLPPHQVGTQSTDNATRVAMIAQATSSQMQDVATNGEDSEDELPTQGREPGGGTETGGEDEEHLPTNLAASDDFRRKWGCEIHQRAWKDLL